MVANDLNNVLAPLAGRVFEIRMMYPYVRIEFSAYASLRQVATAMRASAMWGWLAWTMRDIHDASREERSGWTPLEDDEWHTRFMAGS